MNQVELVNDVWVGKWVFGAEITGVQGSMRNDREREL